MHLIKKVTLAANSKRHAHYSLQLYELDGHAGFVIAKQSGPEGAENAREWWYRPTLEQAEMKYAGIVRTKTRRGTGRRYHEVATAAEHPQLALVF